jgi:hypothetical protein
MMEWPNAQRLAIGIVVFAAASSCAGAQSGPDRPHDQVPRFLRMPVGASREPTVLDPRDEPVLMRRIALNLRDVKYRAALEEISLSADVHFVYAGDLLSRYDEVTVRSTNITVAAALTEVLRGARVDVEVGTKGTLILLRQPPADSLAAAAAADSTAAEAAAMRGGGVQLAPILTVATAESRKLFETNVTMGRIDVSAKELASAPAPLGRDLFRTLQLLPGVEVKNDYSTGLNVRGGESDQNLILLDGYPIYNPFHLGGLLGTFIDPMVGSVELLTGAEPARYGERLSSVLDVRSADEYRSGVHGTGDISLLAASGSAGGAFADGGSWMIGARHTYADVIANLVRRNSLPYGFSDIQAHLTRAVFGGAVLSVTAYSGADGASINPDVSGLSVAWGNHVVGATLTKMMPEPKTLLGLLHVDSMSLLQRASFTTFDAAARLPSSFFDLESSVRDVRAGGSVTLYTGPFDQSAGYEVAAEHLKYSMSTPASSITNFLPRASLAQSLTPVSAWYDAFWRATPKVLVDAGARMDAVTGAGWTGVSPRISAKYFVSNDVALVAATGSYAQWLHSLLQDDAPVQPLEFWIASGSTVPVSRAWQSSFGVEAWTSTTRQVTVEAFYKKYSNLMETNPGADASAGESLFSPVSGRSYGADVMLRQVDTGPFGGWISYSYAVSERTTAAGVTFNPGQDRRHELNAVGNWKRGRYRIAARLSLATGTPYTPVLGEFTRERYDPLGNGFAPDVGGGDVQYISGAPNSARMPFEHRLDVSITRVGAGRRVQVSPYLSIANVYAADNPAVYAYDYGESRKLVFGNFRFLPSIGAHIAY